MVLTPRLCFAGTYDWSELLPIAKDFFCNLWTKTKPVDDDGVPDYADVEKFVFRGDVQASQPHRNF